MIGLGVDGYRRILEQLRPRGRLWGDAPDTLVRRLLESLAAEMARLDARMLSLLRERDPRGTSELLSDWEASAGLPDPCVTTPQTADARRRALVARITATGGASAAYFQGIAESLGYQTPTIDEPSPYVWQISFAEDINVRWARAGAARAGDPIREWGDEQVECLIERLKPAHTTVQFAYGAS